MDKKIRCAIYTRVSTDNQAEVEFNSCEAQEERIKSFINSQENMEIYQVYTDPGWSGANLERPARERTMDKMLERAKKGMWNGGVPPLGYQRVERKLEPDADKAAVVKAVFERFLATGSFGKTYSYLKEKGLTNRNGKLLSKTCLARITGNIVYTGKVKYAGIIYPGLHEAIIPEEVFAQAQMLKSQKDRRYKLNKTYPLGGLIRCADCGSIMTPTFSVKTVKATGQRKYYYYYRCTSTFKFGWDHCSIRQVSAEKLESHIIDNIKRIARDKQYLESLIFKLNFDRSGGRTGYAAEDNRSSKTVFEPEILGELLSRFSDAVDNTTQIERAILFRKLLESIVFSKDKIQMNIFYPCDDEIIELAIGPWED